MNNRQKLLLIGNGLTIDLWKIFLKESSTKNPAKPLDWDIPWGCKQFIDVLPHFKKRVLEIKEDCPKISDFDLFNKISSSTNQDKKVSTEARHYLAIAYSQFQQWIDSLDIKKWEWLKRIDGLRNEIKTIVSFNYELLVEAILGKLGILFRRFGISEEENGIPILKPHGSIDFSLDQKSINVRPVYPLNTFADLNNSPIRALPKTELLQPRVEADIVLPQEYSPYLKYQWVKPGYEHLKTIAEDITCCEIIGLSYEIQDRVEINFILDSLNINTKIIISNPNPPKELIEYLQQKNFKQITTKER